jgi:hypothetical protein
MRYADPVPRASSCPACQVEVNPSAVVCPACKTDLAVCAWCSDITSLRNVQPAVGLFGRARFACDRCNRLGVRCRTGTLGGYCNGLARAEGRFGRQLCASCTKSVFDAGKTIAAWTLIGLVGRRLGPRK